MPRRRSQASLCCARFVKLPKVSAVYKRQLKAITFPAVDHLSESAGTKEGLCCFSPDGSKQQSNVRMWRKVYGVYVFAISNNRLSEHFSSILGHRAAPWIHSVLECTFTFPQVLVISFILLTSTRLVPFSVTTQRKCFLTMWTAHVTFSLTFSYQIQTTFKCCSIHLSIRSLIDSLCRPQKRRCPLQFMKYTTVTNEHFNISVLIL